jgi:lactoylglutathione lyase
MNTLGYAIVFVSNMERSIAFYGDVLGFLVKHHSHKWTELATGETTLALHLSDISEHPHTHTHMPAGHCHVGLTVPNLDAFHAEMVGKGIKCIQPPQEEGFGRLAIYSDPDGLPLSVVEGTSVPCQDIPPRSDG